MLYFIMRLLSSEKSARLQLRLPNKMGMEKGDNDAYLLTTIEKPPRTASHYREIFPFAIALS